MSRRPGAGGYDLDTTLFVSDLDFTLLRSDATLGPYTVEVVNGLVDRGLRFTYATARSHRSASKATRGLRLELPVITYGGTMTTHADTGAPSVVRGLAADALHAILRATDGHPELQPLVHVYAEGEDRIHWRQETETGGVRHFLDARPGDPRLAAVASWAALDAASAYYVSIIGAHAHVAELRDRLHPTLPGCMLILSEDVYAPAFSWLEIHSELGSKAEAVAALAAELGTTRLVAFGDNHNDVPLFGIADEAYAVANAVPELRRLATGIIADNDADAVASWLRQAIP